MIEIYLPKDRRLAGLLTATSLAGEVVFSCSCRGKADNGRAIKEGNPKRLPNKPYGDFPSGGYATAKVTLFDTPDPRLGIGWIALDGNYAVRGDTRSAAKSGGRTGLGIHAGRGNDRLVATFGCLRLLDKDFEALAKLCGGTSFYVEIKDL